MADSVPLANLIDQHISAGLAARGITPAEIASDAEFLRRVTLDLTGRIPDAITTRDFLKSLDPQKREHQIDQLLSSDRFASHLATVFDVTLMERRPDKYVTTSEWRSYLEQSFDDNKPLDVLVAEILGADGVNAELRPAARFYLDRAVEKDVLVRDIGRLFLGVDLQCAQCHDHPDIDDYRHQHYHGLSVFVAGSKTFRQPDGKFVLQEVVLREVEFASVFDPENTRSTGPGLLDRRLEIPDFPEGEEYVEKPSRTVRSVPKFSLRQLLADELPTSRTPQFARNLANRLWAMMMGRGLVHPLDMHHSANPPSHPELLAALSDRLVQDNYDTRTFLRGIALSDSYQRSSLIPAGISSEEIPDDSFAIATMKGLSPEQLFESVLVATQAQAILVKQIDDALAEEARENEGADAPALETDADGIAKARQKQRDAKVSEFIQVFGSVPGQPEGEFSASLPQALFLANSETVSDWVPARLGNLTERLLALDDTTRIADELLLSVLSRKPTANERQLVHELLEDSNQDRSKAMAALVWSLLASAEFRLNH